MHWIGIKCSIAKEHHCTYPLTNYVLWFGQLDLNPLKSYLKSIVMDYKRPHYIVVYSVKSIVWYIALWMILLILLLRSSLTKGWSDELIISNEFIFELLPDISLSLKARKASPC